MEKPKNRDVERAARVKKVARIAGVTEREVRNVLKGDRNNEKIISAYMEILEGENALMEAVKQLIPF